MNNTRASIATLIAQLQDNDAVIREEAAYQLGQWGDSALPDAVEPLIEALKDPADTVRYTVAETLSILKPQEAVVPLIKALASNTEEVLGNMAEALGNIGDRRAVVPLINLLTDADPFVRLFAAEALGKLGDARAVAPLINRLSDTGKVDKRSKERVCDYAAEALRKINTLEARVALERFEKGEFVTRRWWQFWK